MRLLLPELLRKREHSGSSRDSGYSSYFGIGNSSMSSNSNPYNTPNFCDSSNSLGNMLSSLRPADADLLAAAALQGNFNSEVESAAAAAMIAKSNGNFHALKALQAANTSVVSPSHNNNFSNNLSNYNTANNMSSVDAQLKQLSNFDVSRQSGALPFSQATTDLSSINTNLRFALNFQTNEPKNFLRAPVSSSTVFSSSKNFGDGANYFHSMKHSEGQPADFSFSDAKNSQWLHMESSVLNSTDLSKNSHLMNQQICDSGRSSVLPSCTSSLPVDALLHNNNNPFNCGSNRNPNPFRRLTNIDLADQFSLTPEDEMKELTMPFQSSSLRADFITNTNNDDKLCQLLPSDPTAKKNFLDNIQLLNQLSSICPLDDVDAIIPPAMLPPPPPPPPPNRDICNNARSTSCVFNPSIGYQFPGNNRQTEKTEAFILSQILENAIMNGPNMSSVPLNGNSNSIPPTTDGQILELATFLLTNCNNSNIDISLSEVQLMLRRAILQDLYAKNWLTRNFSLPKSRNDRFPNRSSPYFDAVNGCHQEKSLHDRNGFVSGNSYSIPGNKYLHKTDSDSYWSNGEMVSTPNLESYEAMHHMRHDPRSILGNINSVDNFKITSLSNGGFITSKNCANFEKLTMHSSSKDLPCHFPQHFPPPSMANAFANSQAGGGHLNKNGYQLSGSAQQAFKAKGFPGTDLSASDLLPPNQFDLLSPVCGKSGRADMLSSSHRGMQQQLAAEVLAASGKLPPDLLSRHHKLPPELLAAHPAYFPSSGGSHAGMGAAVGPRPSSTLSSEYMRNFPPDLLSFQPNVMAYRQMG